MVILPDNLRKIINPRNLLIFIFICSVISPVYGACDDYFSDVDNYNIYDVSRVLTYIYFNFTAINGRQICYIEETLNDVGKTYTPASGSWPIEGTITNLCNYSINVEEGSSNRTIITTISNWNTSHGLTGIHYYALPVNINAACKSHDVFTYLTEGYLNITAGIYRYGTTTTALAMNVTHDTYFYSGPDFAVSLSGTGTFCYSEPVIYNVSLDGYTDQYAFYYLNFYKDGDPLPYYTAFDGNEDGFYSFSKSLPPGDYASEGIIQFEEYELTDWLNFTIEQDCLLAFNGTINDTSPYEYYSNYTWEWLYYDYLDNLTTWEAPTFDHGNGTSFIDLMYSSGYINESEYEFIYQSVMNAINQSTNSTATGNEYIFGVLTPIEMINDGLITVRSNINASVSFLTDGISPVTSIFDIIFQMMPSWVINIFSIILAFDATRIILAGRKN